MLCFARLALLRQRSPEAAHHIQLPWRSDTTGGPTWLLSPQSVGGGRRWRRVALFLARSRTRKHTHTSLKIKDVVTHTHTQSDTLIFLIKDHKDFSTVETLEKNNFLSRA